MTAISNQHKALMEKIENVDRVWRNAQLAVFTAQNGKVKRFLSKLYLSHKGR